jgi:hypothetical protein
MPSGVGAGCRNSPRGIRRGSPVRWQNGAPMGRILVGSVYGAAPRNPQWYRLQRFFLDQGDDAYELAVFLNSVDASVVPGATIVGATQALRPAVKGIVQHRDGLCALMDHFYARPEYDGYLILDSDAFPIVPNWRTRLEARMRAHDGLPVRWMAAPVRTENLDLFAHPSACYFSAAGLAAARGIGVPLWRIASRTNLLGMAFEELGLDPAFAGGEPRVLPLLRSNAVNPHPVLAAVYGDVFYHHGAGSRPAVRSRVTEPELDGRFSAEANVATDRVLFDALCAGPQSFVRRLLDDETALRIARGEPA